MLLQAHGIVAAAVERGALHAAEVADAGSAMLIRRSRNSYIRSPRRVTFVRRGISSRTRKPAIEFLPLVMTAF